MRHKTALYICLISLLFTACSEQGSGYNKDASVSLPDASDAAVVDSSPDSTPYDGNIDAACGFDSTLYEFCDQPLFKLPIDGSVEETLGLDLWQDKVVYFKNPVGYYTKRNAYLFDISNCTQTQLTHNARGANPSIWDQIIVWNDHRFNAQDPDHCADLFYYDITLGQETRLLDDPMCDWEAETNGRHIAYRKTDYENGIPGSSALHLMDLQTMEVTELVPTWAQVAYLDVSEQYVVWSGVSGEPSSKGRDISYHDLQSGVTALVGLSTQYFTYDVYASGDYLTYMASDEYIMAPYRLFLYKISTGEHVVLLENDFSMPFGMIQQNLVAFPTSKYGGSEFDDIEMYDIDKKLFRRVTTRASNLRPARVYFPYLVMIDVLYPGSATKVDWYVANLVELGIADSQGNLLEGDGVLEPPRLP